jgi:hypothetical protein
LASLAARSVAALRVTIKPFRPINKSDMNQSDAGRVTCLQYMAYSISAVGFAPSLQVLPFDLSLSCAFRTPIVEKGHKRLNPGRECGPRVARVVAKIRERAGATGLEVSTFVQRFVSIDSTSQGASDADVPSDLNALQKIMTSEPTNAAPGNCPQIVLAEAEMFRGSNNCRIVRCPAL